MTAATTEDMPTAPGAYQGNFYLQDIEPIGHFSRIGPDGRHIAFDDSKIRYCRLPVDERINEPHSRQGSFWHDLAEGFEQYVPRQDTGNRTDALCEWAIGMSAASTTPSEDGHKKSLNEVTKGSNVMTDRTTLMKIASTPYANHRYGWKLDVFRIGDTLVICPHAIDAEQQHFNEQGGLKGVYRLEMLKNIITLNKNGDEEKISAASSYNRVLTANLTDGSSSSLKLIYAAKVDCVNRETTNPIEIRTLGKRLRPKDMLDKMLKWHMLSRLSGSHQLLIGVHRADGRLESIEVLPTDFMREFAEHNDAWKAQTCFSFLYEVLVRMRNLLEGKPEGQRLTASYSPNAPTVHFEVHEMGDPQQLFASQKFWEQFGANAVA